MKEQRAGVQGSHLCETTMGGNCLWSPARMHLGASSSGIQQLTSSAWAHSSMTTRSKWASGSSFRGPSGEAPADQTQPVLSWNLGPKIKQRHPPSPWPRPCGSPEAWGSACTCVGGQHHISRLQAAQHCCILALPQLTPQLPRSSASSLQGRAQETRCWAASTVAGSQGHPTHPCSLPPTSAPARRF